MATLAQIDREKLIQIAKAHDITWLALFGSMAGGEAQPQSDVDLAVRFGKQINLFDLVGTQLAMAAALGRSVDLIPIDDAYPFIRQSMADDLGSVDIFEQFASCSKMSQ
ncbi:MAG: nucleotidyltransferase domain-containing protein [Caldilineaceae bacterium]